LSQKIGSTTLEGRVSLQIWGLGGGTDIRVPNLLGLGSQGTKTRTFKRHRRLGGKTQEDKKKNKTRKKCGERKTETVSCELQTCLGGWCLRLPSRTGEKGEREAPPPERERPNSKKKSSEWGKNTIQPQEGAYADGKKKQWDSM